MSIWVHFGGNNKKRNEVKRNYSKKRKMIQNTKEKAFKRNE